MSEAKYQPQIERVRDAVNEIYQEYLKASEKFPPFNTGHEGFAVIYEELEELWEEVKRYPNADKKALKSEAIQVGAMALRFIIDICE